MDGMLLMGLGVVLIVGIWGFTRAVRNVAPRPVAPAPGGADLHDLFITYSAKYRVDWRVLEAIALWEHRGVIRPTDIGHEENGTESIGVMQLNSSNFAWIGRTLGFSRADLFNPRHNIEAGAALLRSMITELGYPSAFNLSITQRDKLIQSWSLGTPNVKKGKTNPAYLAGVLSYLETLA